MIIPLNCGDSRRERRLAWHYDCGSEAIPGPSAKDLSQKPRSNCRRSAKVTPASAEARQAELFEQIGRLKMELEWVKKKAAVFM